MDATLVSLFLRISLREETAAYVQRSEAWHWINRLVSINRNKSGQHKVAIEVALSCSSFFPTMKFKYFIHGICFHNILTIIS